MRTPLEVVVEYLSGMGLISILDSTSTGSLLSMAEVAAGGRAPA